MSESMPSPDTLPPPEPSPRFSRDDPKVDLGAELPKFFGIIYFLVPRRYHHRVTEALRIILWVILAVVLIGGLIWIGWTLGMYVRTDFWGGFDKHMGTLVQQTTQPYIDSVNRLGRRVDDLSTQTKNNSDALHELRQGQARQSRIIAKGLHVPIPAADAVDPDAGRPR